jgi:hypothetical protein
MKLSKLFKKTENEQDTFDLAVELNLINTSVKICDCGKNMHLERGN